MTNNCSTLAAARRLATARRFAAARGLPTARGLRAVWNSARRVLPIILLVCGSALALTARAQDDSDNAWSVDSDRHLVSIGHDVELGKGEKADGVVSVLGSATVDGDVRESVVAVLGDAHVSGNVGENTVAVLGNAYIDSRIDGNVVAVLGNVRLGPHADVHGQVVEVLGTVERSPTAAVEGGTIGVLTGIIGDVTGLHEWVRRCLLYLRPLAPDLGLGWVWGVAIATLAFYLLLAAVFRDGLQRCIQTLDTHPGPSVLAALLSTLLVPTLLLALVITVVGIAVIPFFWLGLFCVGVFGRVVALGWLGGRCLRLAHANAVDSAVLCVLCGGVVALALYMVPVLGFVVYALLGFLGFGAVIYTLVLAVKAVRQRPPAGGPQVAGTGAGSRATGHAPSGGAVPPSAAAASSWSGTQPPEPGTRPPGSDMPPPETGTQPPGPGTGAPSSGPDAPSGSQGGRNAPPVDPHIAATLPRAGFWIRMGALLLDLVLVGFALSLLYHGARGTLLILAVYAAIMWKVRGTTIGGIVFDLQVVRLDGRPIDWETAIVRALGCFLSLVILGLGFLWIAIDPERQAWHDKLAGTVVVRLAKGVALV